ncbi:MAG: hypothetical protein R6U89_10145 [Dehalococcoidia bacterium]
MRLNLKLFAFMAVILMVVSSLMVACGDDGDTTEPTDAATEQPTATPTTEPATPEPSPEPAELEFYKNPDYPEDYQNPLSHLPFPEHPYLAPNGKSNMHNDAYMSDTYEVSGPVGVDTQVDMQRYASSTNLCVTITFDSEGRILTVNARPDAFYLLLIDPNTLEELASYQLPPRHADDPLYPYKDTSGGAYFVLDNQDRVIVADADNNVRIIAYSEDEGDFQLVEMYELADYVVPLKLPARDHVQMAIPDWDGLLWFTTRYGKVGTIEEGSGTVSTIELTGEEIQNSFTVGEDGVYIVTDHAMYRFHAGENGEPVQDWRTEYDRGSRVKPSMMNQGSGTTPQLFGDMVAIGDNADPRMNILFLRRSDGTVICHTPVFEEGISTTENALPGFAREGAGGTEYSVIVENNYGRNNSLMFEPGGCCQESVGGVARVDLVPDGDGGFTCEEIWTSPENSCTTVPKLSLANGIVYLYTYQALADEDYGYYLTGVDFESGETVFRIPVGTGFDYQDFGAPITLSPEGGTAYIGGFGGLIAIRDSGY